MPVASLVEPAWHTAPEYVRTDGPLVAELGELCGFSADREQRLVLDDIFAVGEDGRSAAFEVAVIAARQNLKTGILRLAALGKVFICEQRLGVWSAHEFRASQEAFRDLLIMLESAPDLEREVLRVTTATGSEGIEFTGDRRLIFKARTSGSGRSLSGDTVFLDEGFALMPPHMGALVPTLAARPDPQLIYGSSAGMASSAVLRSLRDRGRRGSPRLAYVEWCAPERECLLESCDHQVGAPGCALDDVELWWAANTALHRGRITLETIAGMRAAMPPDQFRRECLGWWDDPTGEAVISGELWGDLADQDARIAGPPVFGLDVAPNHSWAALGVAGRVSDGRFLVELTHRGDTLDHRPGIDWVLERLDELKDARHGLRIKVAAGSAAMALKPALDLLGVYVDVVPDGDVRAACGFFYAQAVGRTLVHSGQAALADAVASSRKDVDDGERAWKWHRRRSGADIAPSYAVTLALWGLVADEVPAEVSVYGPASLDLCDECQERPHGDPDGDHEYRCEQCRETEGAGV